MGLIKAEQSGYKQLIHNKLNVLRPYIVTPSAHSQIDLNDNRVK